MVESIAAARVGLTPATATHSKPETGADPARALPLSAPALRGPGQRSPTEAEERLARILGELKQSNQQQAAEAARRKLEQIKIKLKALQLAANTAAAGANPRAAKALAREIGELARELTRALRDAGQSPITPSGAGGAEVLAAKASPPPDVTALKVEAREAATGLKKVLSKARLALLNPLAERAEARKAAAVFGEAERALAGLEGASFPVKGSIFNVTA